MDTVYFPLFLLNVAVTVFVSLTETVHAPLPTHAPLQPTNVANLVGLALKLIVDPRETLRLHFVPQSTPVGLEITRPKSVAALITVSVAFCRSNRAVTFCTWLIFTRQELAPVQAPLQPAKVEPGSGIASRVTAAPLV